MNRLHHIATGRLISSTILAIPNVPSDRAVKFVVGEGIWNETTLEFDEIPPPTLIDRSDFMSLFLDDELDKILDAENTDKHVRRLLKNLDLCGFVNLESTKVRQGVKYMEAMGYIGVGRAEKVLANEEALANA